MTVNIETIFKTDLETQLLAFIESVLLPMGYRAVDLDCRVSGRSLLRLFIEKTENSSQVTLDDCVNVSRTLEPLIEEKKFFSAAYELEVSSPGLDRRLRKITDFQSSLGKEIKIAFCESVEGLGAQTRGVLKDVEKGRVHLQVSGKDFWVNINQIKKAQTVWQFKMD